MNTSRFARQTLASVGICVTVLMTRRGIAYEVPGVQYSGLYEPFTRRRFEFRLPPDLGYVHTGWDPEGRLWFYECRGKIHQMIALLRLDEQDGDDWQQLCGDWPTYGGGQKAHFHPQLTPDSRVDSIHWRRPQDRDQPSVSLGRLRPEGR